jgi:hypothetical protein
MNKLIVLVSVAAGFILTGCGSKQDANEKNFSAAISQYLDQKGELCLTTSGSKWPVDVTKMDLAMKKAIPYGVAGAMEALATAGLVSEVDVGAVKRYSLSDMGKNFIVRKKSLSTVSEVNEKLCKVIFAMEKNLWQASLSGKGR